MLLLVFSVAQLPPFVRTRTEQQARHGDQSLLQAFRRHGTLTSAAGRAVCPIACIRCLRLTNRGPCHRSAPGRTLQEARRAEKLAQLESKRSERLAARETRRAAAGAAAGSAVEAREPTTADEFWAIFNEEMKGALLHP